jgi:gliding motility-associated lipoprotein GldD
MGKMVTGNRNEVEFRVAKWHMVAALAACLFLASCSSRRTTPKPRGYYRIELPQEHGYTPVSLKNYPYSFNVSSLAKVAPASEEMAEPYWINISYPDYNAKIHISYKAIKGNFDKYVEDTHYLVFKHTVKADAITEQRFEGADGRTFGSIYEIGGNAASNVQFYLTDSTRHFLRGSLYFNTQPNRDSLNPVIEYITEDIRHLIESTKWQ